MRSSSDNNRLAVPANVNVNFKIHSICCAAFTDMHAL